MPTETDVRRRLRRVKDPELNLDVVVLGLVYGIDISDDAISYARERLGLEVQCADLLQVDLGASRYDVACLWDTRQ